MAVKPIYLYFKSVRITCCLIVLISACKHTPLESDSQAPPATVLNTDSFLFAQSLVSTSYNWYQQNDSIFRSSPQSPHSKYFRVRFNTTAINKLTDSGRLAFGNFFDDGSLVIKELYDSIGAPIKYLAIMYKDKTSKNHAQGWVWLEIKGNGDKYISSDEKGTQCVSCHSSGRDYIRLFDIF